MTAEQPSNATPARKSIVRRRGRHHAKVSPPLKTWQELLILLQTARPDLVALHQTLVDVSALFPPIDRDEPDHNLLHLFSEILEQSPVEAVEFLSEIAANYKNDLDAINAEERE